MHQRPQGSDRLANYVPVAERVTAAAPEIQLLQSDSPVMLTDVLGYIRVTITLVDGRTATGIAQFRLDATKGAQATNPLEDAETSAVGRALGFLGYSSNRSIATREDVERAQAMQARQAQPPTVTPEEAEAKFWDTFAPVLGGQEWPLVEQILGAPTAKPRNVGEWRSLYSAVNTAVKAEIARAEA
jgi:hypothetical protein